MDILVLGGTSWLGGRLARSAMGAGHEVTCLARGESGGAPEGARLVRADRTEPDAYAGLPASGEWDLVVDVSWQPGFVRGALRALSGRAERWVYVSSCSVYADQSTPGADESAALLPPHDGDEAAREQYGEAKVACELACQDARGDGVLIARSGLIVGHGDLSDRFGYWPGRFALAVQDGSPVLVPQHQRASVQVVDVLDLAGWLIVAGRAGVTGVVNASGPAQRLDDVLAVCRDVAGFEGEVVPVADERLAAAGVEEFMGSRSLPLWLHDPAAAGFMARDTTRARSTGLGSRRLQESATDALRWERELGLNRTGRKAGLDRADELAILGR